MTCLHQWAPVTLKVETDAQSERIRQSWSVESQHWPVTFFIQYPQAVSLNYTVQVEFLLCARHCFGHQRHSNGKDPGPVFLVLSVYIQSLTIWTHCARVLISTGFPGLQLYVWVLVSSTQLCSICSLSSLFVQISSAIYNSWLERHNPTGESRLGMCQGLEYRAQKLKSVCFPLRFILFLKGYMVPIWGTSIIQPSVIRLLDGVANLVPHGPCA